MANEFFTDKHDKDGSPAGHRARVRKKIFDGGFDSLQDYEKIEAMLFYVIPRSDTKPLAIRLVDKFGSFAGVMDASFEELQTVDGCGESVAFFITFMAMIAQNYLNSEHYRPILFNNGDSISDYIARKYVGKQTENLLIICLNDNNELLGEEMIDSYDAYEINVNLKIISHYVHKFNASKFLLAHNHPQGIGLPSREDYEMNNQVIDFFKRIGITLIEHYIVKDGKCSRMMI